LIGSDDWRALRLREHHNWAAREEGALESVAERRARDQRIDKTGITYVIVKLQHPEDEERLGTGEFWIRHDDHAPRRRL
jgi:hypothetical protein